MKTITLSIAFGVSILHLPSSAQVGVQSGNTAGLSDVSTAQSMTIPRPQTPASLQAVRINRNSVRVSLSSASNLAYTRVMRATDTENWALVRVWLPGAAPAEFIDPAGAGKNYKYLAQHIQVTGNFGAVTSPPTGIEYVEDVPALTRAGEWSYLADPFWEPATGSASFSNFYPDYAPASAETVDPNPFFIYGPFAQSKLYDGFFTTRVLLTAEASIETYHFIPLGFAEVRTYAAWSEFLSSGGYTFKEDPPGSGSIYSLNTGFGFYESRWTGNPVYGYDKASNPHWQMLPIGGDRAVTLDIQPEIGTWGTGLFAPGIDLTRLGGTPILSVVPGETRLVLTQSGGPFGMGESELLPNGLKVPLKIDARPRVDLKIKVVRLLMRQKWKGSIYLDADADVPDPDIAALQQELNATFGEQANIFFTVDKQTIIQDDDDDMTLPDEDTDGRPTFNVLQGNAAVGQFFTNLANTNRSSGYIFTIYCSRFANTFSSPNKPDGLFPGSFANNLGAPFARFAVITSLDSSLGSYSHEIGHLLGLHHTWDPGPNYSEDVLPDDARGRLMCYDRTGKRLVKSERDVIHANLIELLKNVSQ